MNALLETRRTTQNKTATTTRTQKDRVENTQKVQMGTFRIKQTNKLIACKVLAEWLLLANN